jgi:hypothetical protein
MSQHLCAEGITGCVLAKASWTLPTHLSPFYEPRCTSGWIPMVGPCLEIRSLNPKEESDMLGGLEQWSGPKTVGPKHVTAPPAWSPSRLYRAVLSVSMLIRVFERSGGQPRTSFTTARGSGETITRSRVRRIVKTTRRTRGGFL